ncbi:hypothetical protein HCN44_005275 [Aphidius gifuensis]|uniref:Uncharacterized protein n=1 Tax=Aphidius gifuensis TaxID=684658 RepID=A0A834Y484_APHGI|nr:uncharacterized protein DDB_G0283697-like isoform X2 [Aphidius gifuensis]XP_044014177.1 uncharacterized protein DDB_G0283697-like isoform X2 [Aphidius gifuensis]KAF7996998.1 hypothetical protein HCN44_005275 [Aphidius gifuensis]
MARAVTQRWRNPAPEGDDVQRSIELLDKVLSEYDEYGSSDGDCCAGGIIPDPGGVGGVIIGGSGDCASGVGETVDIGNVDTTDANVHADGDIVKILVNIDEKIQRGSSTEPSTGLTPDDESPSLGHQSEDDGYMSMNGRKAKMALVALRPVPDCPEPQDISIATTSEFPPPPEEAERIISTLLPIVSPSNSSKKQNKNGKTNRRCDKKTSDELNSSSNNNNNDDNNVTCQTTLPKVRRRKLHGLWDRSTNGTNDINKKNYTSGKFSSLPLDIKVSYDWILDAKYFKNKIKSQDKHRSRHRHSTNIDTKNINLHNDDDDGDKNGELKNDDLKKFVDNDKCKNNLDDDDDDEEDEEDEIDVVEEEEKECTDDPDDDDDNDDDDDDDQSNERINSDSSCDVEFPKRRRRKRKFDIARGTSESESEPYSTQRSSSVSIRRYSMRANCDSSDFSRGNSTSNERFHSDFSIAVASASSNDRLSIPTSDPFSIRNLDFATSGFSLGHANSCDERFSDVYSTRNSDFSTRNSIDFRTQSEDDDRFSDDSLEEILRATIPPPPPPPPPPSTSLTSQTKISLSSSSSPPPPPPSLPLQTQPSTLPLSTVPRDSSQSPTHSSGCKRHSVAWEVSLDEDPIYGPGSTKVVGRRRRRSSDVSSVGSTSKSRDLDYDWVDSQRRSTTDDDLISPYSPDTSTNEGELEQPISKHDLPCKNGTYVIRGRTRKRERKPLLTTTSPLPQSTNNNEQQQQQQQQLNSNVSKRYSNTYDDIKSLLREGRLEGLNEPPPNFVPPIPPDLVRVSSLPEFDEVDNKNCDLKKKNNNNIKNNSETSSTASTPPKNIPILINKKNHTSMKKPTITMSKSLDINKTNYLNNDIIINKKPITTTSRKKDFNKNKTTQSKIPVNLLIEDQIVKKALNENRRQLEKVSDAIKEIESVKNSESYTDILKYKNNDDDNNGNDNDDNKKSDVNNIIINSDSENSINLSRDNDNYDAGCCSNKNNIDLNDIVYSSSKRLLNNGKNNNINIDNNISILKNEQRQIEYVIDAILEDSKKPDFKVSVDVLEFPPLPPSPVEEEDIDDEENFNIGNNNIMTKVINSTTNHYTTSHRTLSRLSGRSIDYRPKVPPHRIQTIDIKDNNNRSSHDTTRSMDAGYSRSRRATTAAATASSNISTNSRRDVPIERRTLPNDLPGPSRRRTSSRHSPSTENAACSSSISSNSGTPMMGTMIMPIGNSGMQTSCSLPETPVFARGSDIPRTPQHTTGGTLSTTTTNSAASTTAGGTQPRRQPGWYAPATSTTGGYRRNNPGLEQAIIGTELLRLAGGPSRGWYPTRRSGNQPRPASIEHLERLNSAYESRLPTTIEQRKPLTLPTNITPNKYFGQSKHSTAASGTREALRRVTSLLIKKGSGKDSKGSSKDNVFPSGPYTAGEPSDAPKKKGFFKNFWKRSRHYSLENQ